MISFRPIIHGATGLVLLASAPFSYPAPEADSPVQVESLSAPASQTSSSPVIEYRPPIEEEAEAGYSAFEAEHQRQLLQREVQRLRGQVEELRYQLEQMQSTQQDRYLELDNRFQMLQRQISAGAATVPAGDAAPSMADVTTPAPAVGPVPQGDDGELYSTALELIRNRQYDMAIAQLDALIGQYPDGDLTANAYYWLGEVYAAKPEPDYEGARLALSQVINDFPESRKVPDAAFKLGKVYHLMGDCVRAEQLLNQVANDYRGRSVGQLAEDYLRDKVDCGA